MRVAARPGVSGGSERGVRTAARATAGDGGSDRLGVEVQGVGAIAVAGQVAGAGRGGLEPLGRLGPQLGTRLSTRNPVDPAMSIRGCRRFCAGEIGRSNRLGAVPAWRWRWACRAGKRR